MSPEKCQVALKEWAVTVRALAQGQQILLLRKGGIHEEGKDFRVIHPEFLLYQPTSTNGKTCYGRSTSRDFGRSWPRLA